MPAGRPMALDAERPAGRPRRRVSCRLLGSPRLEGPLCEPALQRAPGPAAGRRRARVSATRRRCWSTGADWRRWPELPGGANSASLRMALQRDGDQVDIKVAPTNDASRRWSLWWVALEDGHDSDVRAGENSGVRLHHDHVVRHYGSIAPWSGPLVQRNRGAGARRSGSSVACDRGGHRRRQWRHRAGRPAALRGLKRAACCRLRRRAASRSPSRRS